jgi:hypothetical protein
MALLSGLGVFGTLFTTRGGKLTTGKGKSLLLMAGLALLTVGMSFTVACGSYSNHQAATNHQATLMVTGTSGGVNHSVPIAITVR